MLELDVAARAEQNPRIVPKRNADFTIAARLEAIILVNWHNERSGSRGRSVSHSRGPRQCFDKPDGGLLGMS